MVWTWRYEKADGTAVAPGSGQAEEFSGQGDAESWIGENWKQLAEDGVDRAVLLDDDREIYTMSLHEG
ncbi:hypothetical protein WN990_04060 [Kitasatospora purpeofusca]|uniref:hypothetical protein n=1 Tax=Kitasatospora purpeofusca TaxID=67352 RepID=UPI000B138E1F|nr:hypothetical protein [Kitasatospora purpeofusca]MCX4752347.1 hypothetical protein [Kitasatospora purpeofusca]WSR31923.1 hypothetical protein OG715_13620 [Kitasatospora purpeofusca]WSR39950.1 hypothetical protein OG196_13095 [Kitasatospora purpeofusca]